MLIQSIIDFIRIVFRCDKFEKVLITFFSGIEIGSVAVSTGCGGAPTLVSITSTSPLVAGEGESEDVLAPSPEWVVSRILLGTFMGRIVSQS